MSAARPGSSPPPAPIRAAWIAGTAGIIGFLSWQTVAAPYPSLLSPYSLTVVVPYWIQGPLLAFALYPALFLVHSAGLGFGRIRRPWLAGFAIAVFDLVSIFFTMWGLRPGLLHYGPVHTLGMLLVNGLFVVTLAVVFTRAFRRPSFAALLAFRGLFWAWIAWSGLPWLRQLF